jgi:hypothetical protein
MEIKNVDYTHLTDEEKLVGKQISFIVEFADGTITSVPFDPNNRHYWEVKEWMNKQEVKPFKFDFDAYAAKVRGEQL